MFFFSSSSSSSSSFSFILHFTPLRFHPHRQYNNSLSSSSSLIIVFITTVSIFGYSTYLSHVFFRLSLLSSAFIHIWLWRMYVRMYVSAWPCTCLHIRVRVPSPRSRTLAIPRNARNHGKAKESKKRPRKQNRNEGKAELSTGNDFFSLSLSLSLFRWGKNKNSEFAVCLSIGCKPRDLFTRSVLRVFLASSVAKCVRRERAIWFFPYTHVYNRARVHSSRFNSRDRA